MTPPVIGLSTYAEPAEWAAWHAPAALLPLNYISQVSDAGGIPVLLPPVPGVAAAVRRLDGLILTGGGDLDPARYGARPHPATGRVQPERDQAEFELVTAAIGTGVPVLGICRGMQVLNVTRGGTLCQHLPPHAGHTPVPGTFASHRVRIAPGSRLAAIFASANGGNTHGDGQDPQAGTLPGRPAPPAGRAASGHGAQPALEVPTAHHQAIGRLGDGLTATAWADDGVVEAVELAPGQGRHPFTLAVQWHPEAGQDVRLMRALVSAASSR